MRPLRLPLLSIGILVLACAAHAGAPAGLRVTAAAGQTTDSGNPGYYGAGAVLDAPLAPVCRAGVRAEYRRLLPRSGMLTTDTGALPLRGGSDLGAVLATLDLRAPVRGHSSPFLRTGLGFGYLRAGDTARLDNSVPWGRWETVPGQRRVGLTTASAVGFGRLPAAGLGWEIGLELMQFMSPGAGVQTVGLSMGVVY